MKPKLILCLALVFLSMPLWAQETTNSFRNVSIAEVKSIRLEVEQIAASQNGIQIRIRDYAAHNYGKKEISCDLYEIGDDGKEAKKPFMRVTLKQASLNPDEYLGGASDRGEFEHGNKFKVVYKSDRLPLPISTWSACYYH